VKGFWGIPGFRIAEIKFGTFGWRAIITADFTFENVRLATARIVELLKKSSPHPHVIVGCVVMLMPTARMN
jgi:phosphomannomutase